MGPENISNDTAEARAAAGFTSLLVLLPAAERRKDAPLTEFEVAALRDQALARLTPPTDRRQLGYRDLDPDDVWAEWQAFRAVVQRNGGS